MNATARATPEQQLGERWRALLDANPGIRIRQAADELGVSEMDLVHLRPAEELAPLRPEFAALMQDMKSVGPVMILARNDQVVHEVTAAFGEFTVGGSGAMGLAVGDVDVRVFFRQWAHGFHVQEQVRSGNRESLQFFDRHGMAIQKIYRVEDTDEDAWKALVAAYRASDAPPVEVYGRRVPLVRADMDTVDVKALRIDWEALRDVHHFGAMLKRHGVDRLTALQQVGDQWARRLPDVGGDESSILDILLENVRASRCPVMFFVGNPGIVQIHTGVVGNPRRMGPWMNVLDEGFNLHANTSGISDWFRVRKPTVDGVITSLEAYNRQGDIVLTVFGERKPGQPELTLWRREMDTLEATLCG
ncbi:hemin-degrading factor [Marinobacter zhanjiangensis]|uniref:Hemin-degrading factor n=1 Tax=Marinobacter zhanjiangensis TaxID=578215 RepID=A0ABQ3B5L1_9GAMM|nr:ChuX/HutX family heme-like substrate-binding protein [Marinobacter zhanjiangensis]GGY80734.1 hemin-degrading factor [Marinobacter zhanjiangensis]